MDNHKDKNRRGFCWKCFDELIDIGKTYESIKDYIDTMNPEIKIRDEEYKERLKKCASCDKLIGITCMLCGCYVPVRAVKKAMRCPDADDRKW